MGLLGMRNDQRVNDEGRGEGAWGTNNVSQSAKSNGQKTVKVLAGKSGEAIQVIKRPPCHAPDNIPLRQTEQRA
jgi:hypothetical protein